MTTKTRTSRNNRKALKYSPKGLAILEGAKRIFAERGFHAATVSSIAKKAHVSEATIYEYFSTKEELLFSIPAEKILEYHKQNRDILQYIHGATNRLRFVIYRHLELYASDADYARVAMLILKTNRNFINTEAYKIVQASARNTLEVLQQGIKSGEFRPNMQPYLVRAMIWGTIEHLVIRKSLLGKPEDLLSLADEITNTIFQGILAPQKETALNVHVTMD
jgi:TetR/AcrR family transcriptional regulator, fatty acid metabolism regulator protein